MDRETQIVEWFKEKFSSRTPPKSVLDCEPSYRVYWTEIREKMGELGYTEGVVDLSYEWSDIYKRHKLKRWCNKKMQEAGEERRL